MVKIVETKNHNKIVKLVDKFGGETDGLENVSLSWIALMNNKEVGISGVVEVNDSCWILDPLAVGEDYRDKGIEEKLIEKAIDYAKQNDVKILYNMTKYVKVHENCGFKKVSIDELPQDAQSLIVCFSCNKFKRDCFPELVKLEVE